MNPTFKMQESTLTAAKGRKMADQKPRTPAQIAADKIFTDNSRHVLSEPEAKQKAFHENRERLKAERVARETAAKANS